MDSTHFNIQGGDSTSAGIDILPFTRKLIKAGNKCFSSVGQKIRTFPAVLPVRSLDRIFYRGPLELQHAFASRSKLARQASDHLPLVADFEFVS